MPNPIRIEHDDLIAALEARRPWAADLDRAALKEHRAAEREWADGVKAKAREIAKLSYADLSAAAKGYSRLDLNGRAPECPTSKVALLDKALSALRLSSQKTFTIDNDGPWRHVHWLLTHDEAAASSMC